MIKKIIAFLVIIFVLVIFWRMKAVENLEIKKYNLQNGFKQETIYVWKDNGTLEEIITKYKKWGKKTQVNITRFKDKEDVVVNGEELVKQEIDFEKSKINAPHFPAYSAVFVVDRRIQFGERDEDGDGNMNSRSYYKDNEGYMSTSSSKDNGKMDIWTYYKDGYPTHSEYDSNGDGKPDTPGIPPADPKTVGTVFMRPKNLPIDRYEASLKESK